MTRSLADSSIRDATAAAHQRPLMRPPMTRRAHALISLAATATAAAAATAAATAAAAAVSGRSFPPAARLAVDSRSIRSARCSSFAAAASVSASTLGENDDRK